LAALAIVIRQDQDLLLISEDHPGIRRHIFYDSNARFPNDLSHLLPENAGERWWERLGEI
jgi:hypothetical protein